MDVTSKGLGSVVGGVVFLPKDDQNVVLSIVAVTALFVGTSVLVSSLFRFVAQRTYK